MYRRLPALLSFTLLILTVCCVVPGRCEDVDPHVLVIESYHGGNIWDAGYIQGLHDTLDGRARLTTFEMDTKRLPKEMHEERAEAAWREYLRVEPDLVVLGDDNALKLLGRRFLETSTPVVYLGINNNPRNYIPDGKNITGVLERPLLRRNILVIRDILGLTNGKILLLFDESTTSFVAMEQEFGGEREFHLAGISVDLLFLSDFNEWQEAVVSAADKGYDALIVGLYFALKEDGEHVPAPYALAWTAEHTPVPSFCFWSGNFGKHKTIGGILLDGREHGRAAGSMIRDVLSGVSPEKLPPVIPDQGKYMFSRSRLEKWNLTLPEHIRTKAMIVP